MADVIYFGPSAGDLKPVRAPHSMKQTVADIDAASTTRTSQGKMVRSRVRGGASAVRTIALEWDVITEEDASTILRAVEASSFYMRYRDIRSAAERTAQFYVGDREIEVRRVMQGGRYMVQSLSFSCIEV